MSYDVYLVHPAYLKTEREYPDADELDVVRCDNCGQDISANVWERNITYNVGGMFSLAGLGVYDSFNSPKNKGMTAGDWIPAIEAALAHMTDPANEAEYTAMNPGNGWGSHGGAVDFVEDLLSACKRYPFAVIGAS